MTINRGKAGTILSIVGAVGVIVTTIMAIKATPKALEKIEEAEEEKGEELTRTEKIKIAGPTYVPTVIAGVSTVVCILGANVLNKRQQAALVSAYALLDNSYKEYKRKLIELHGKETHDEIVEALAVEKAKEVGINATNLCTNTCLTDSKSCGDPVIFYDEWSGRYFESTIEQVIAAEYHINRNFVLRGYVALNELYEFLGIEVTDYGSTVGWSVEDELYWIDFDNRKAILEDGLEVYIIETPWGPTTEALEYYYY